MYERYRMRRIELIVAYDGTKYCGWQVQNNGITIEEVLNRELSKLLKEEIKVIGAEADIPDCQAPVRLIIEQLIAQTGIPPFLLGLNWSSTERMSSQQADIMTSELTALRRTLTPVVEKICRLWLRMHGYVCGFEVVWDDINLQDQVEEARAMLYREQARKLRIENDAAEGI